MGPFLGAFGGYYEHNLGVAFRFYLLTYLYGFPLNSMSNSKNKHALGAYGTQLWFESQCEEFL